MTARSSPDGIRGYSRGFHRGEREARRLISALRSGDFPGAGDGVALANALATIFVEGKDGSQAAIGRLIAFSHVLEATLIGEDLT